MANQSRRGEVSKSGVRRFTSKPDLVGTELIYPVTLTTDNVSGFGFSITAGQGGSLAQHLFRVYDKDDNVVVTVPRAGGPSGIGKEMRALSTQSGSYISLNGTTTPVCLEFPDGTSQGAKMWSGTGAPSGSTVGTPTAGDFYIRRATYAPPTLVAASATNAQAQSSLAVGSGTLSSSNTTKLLDGVPAAGDLLIVVTENNNSSETMTCGATASITATGTDGGVTGTDSTRYVKLFSHVIQSGDISSSQVLNTSSSHSTGAGRRIVAYVYRHAGGWATTGSLFGCPLVTSDTDTASGAGDITLSGTGGVKPSVSVAGWRASSNSGAGGTNFRWDNGTATNLSADDGTSASTAATSAKPGLGTNTSGTPGYSTGGTSVVLSNNGSGNQAAAMGNWAINTATLDSSNWLYKYNGSSWVVIL